MKNYSDITFKYLKNQKKRSILTIIGIVLSVALVSSMGTMFYSMVQSEINAEKRASGDYHFAYNNVDKALLNKLKNNTKVDSVAVKILGKESIPIKKEYSMAIDKYDENALKTLPVNIKEGRKPKNENEIVIEKWALELMENKPKINDKINFNIGNDRKEYLLVGVLQNNIGTQYTGKSKAITFTNLMPENAQFQVYIKLSPKVSIRDSISEFSKITEKNKFQPNNMLLTLLGESPNDNMNKGIYTMLGVLVLVVVIATIAVIYNAFHISVLERIRQFGILRSIGAAPKQIRKIVFKEATVLAFIGIPIGLFCGVAGLKIVLFIINQGINTPIIKTNEILVSPNIMIGSILVGMVSVYLSAFIPARRASKVSPLDAINNRGSLIKEKIKRKKGILTKFMKIETVMAHQNIRRNRKRFRITTFSIGISVFLYMVFSSNVNMLLQVNGQKGNEELNLSYKIYKQDTKKALGAFTGEEYKNIKSVDGVDKVYKAYTPLINKALISSDKMDKQYLDAIDNNTVENNGKKYNVINSTIEAYDSERLKEANKYLKSGTVEEDKINKENGVIIVLKNMVRSKKYDKFFIIDIASLKVGDEILLDMKGDSEKKVFPQQGVKVKVLGILEMVPFGEEYCNGNIEIISTEKVIKDIAKDIDKTDYKSKFHQEFKGINLLGFDVKLKAEADRKTIGSQFKNMAEKDSSIKFLDVEEKQKEQKRAMLQLAVFLYGFVILIALIGSLNIVNTVSTNMMLRKREFSTLKAIGMTMRQIKKMVIYEGVLYGIIGSFYGLAIGLPLSYLLTRNSPLGFLWTMPWKDISIVVFGSVGIGLLSIIIPLRRIEEGNIIEDIRVEQ